MSKRKYHLIIPVDADWDKPLNEDALDDQTHLLHGLIHCNGFGHLICINGKEAGSRILCGREVMDLWDRICTSLQVRYTSYINSISPSFGLKSGTIYLPLITRYLRVLSLHFQCEICLLTAEKLQLKMYQRKEVWT